MELGPGPEDLVDLSRCRGNPWYANIRINEDVLDLCHVHEYHPHLQTVSVVAEESPNRYSSVVVAGNGRQVIDFIRRHVGHVYILSLLDVAIISGDLPKASALCSIGVQQRCEFSAYLFFNPLTGVADSRTARALATAEAVCGPLYNRLRASPEVLRRALTGKVDSVPAMLMESGISVPLDLGNDMFAMRKVGMRNHWHFHLRMDCLQRLLAAGVDPRPIVVNPILALCRAVEQYKCLEIRAFIRGILEDLEYAIESGRLTFRNGRTLLEMSIRCGQFDATRLLIRAGCDASSLLASELEGPLFRNIRDEERKYPWRYTGDCYDVTINGDVASAEVARVAYHLCRHRHQVVLVQLTGWWSRHGAGVHVLWSRVIDHIASFALAVPPLPEIMNLPRPMGTRNAARRAARRRAKLGYGALNEGAPDFKHPASESSDNAVQKVIEEVMHDPMEQPATISEGEASATSRALWEAAVEMRATETRTDVTFSLEEGESASTAREEVYLAKLNRIPKQLRSAFADGPALRPCRDALQAEGLSWKLSSGAMIFVSPWQYTAAIIALSDLELHPDHLVFSRSMEYLVEEVLQQHSTWVKDRSVLDIQEFQATSRLHNSQHQEEESDKPRADPGAGDIPSWQPFMFVEKTFVCLAPMRSTALTTASSTDVHRDANPRRSAIPEFD
ncbi:unnamed protein product [Symbiodinium sp. CCMP2456]|nr:unnamed protein product [Symbiodinium sp. CCMP2456]